ncbi:MAG: metal ABC transporter solute-binding protein, Zn/Mn family [Terasakiella sp.]|uniref:metal ABC transporter solute-binding protein, Zn/Mn family n=1 Tax=unclassified Terasakiella TaxID=2614952 RepID=UPI003B00C9B2
MFWRKSLVIATALVGVLSTSAAYAAQKTEVIATIKPIHSLLSSLMKDVGTPVLLIKDKVPLNYVPSETDLQKLKKADLVVWMGPELEQSLSTSLSNSKNAFEMLSYSDFKILPQRNNDKRRDPYMWLDVRNAEVMVDALYDNLVNIDPKHEKTYTENRRAMKREIAALDRKFEFGFRSIAAGQSWLYHDTQQYFEQSYAFKVRDILATNAGDEADMANMLTLRAKLNDMGPVCFFTEEGLTDKNLSFALDGSDTKVATLKSYGLSFKTGPGLYQEMMQYNFDTIANCFKDIGATYVEPTKRKKPE